MATCVCRIPLPSPNATFCIRCLDGLPVPAPSPPSSAPLALRPEVAAFAQLMEQKLRENDHKRGWRCCTVRYLSVRLGNELAELRRVLAERTKFIGKGRFRPDVDPGIVRRIGGEAADVANFAMMIADVCGGLAAKEGSQ